MKLVECIQEPSGKVSSTRIVFLVWSMGLLAGWLMGREPSWEVLLFAATLGGVKLVQRNVEHQG